MLLSFTVNFMGRCHPRVGSQRKGGTKKKRRTNTRRKQCYPSSKLEKERLFCVE
jgi:hypothetical protein